MQQRSPNPASIRPFTSQPVLSPRPPVPRPAVNTPRPAVNTPRPAVNTPRPAVNTPRPAVAPRLSRPPIPYARPPPSANSSTVDELLHQLIEEVRCGREENKRLSDDIKKISKVIGKLEENYHHLRDDFREQNEASFSIEKSTYKDNLMKEVGILFARSLLRQPSREEIGESIVKVLGEEGKNRFKFNMAKTFCSNRLTELRCEERRRLFGNKPCESFPQLTTDRFVDRMLSIVKAPNELKPKYTRHVALLRKFAREITEAKQDTYKRFRIWIEDNFATGLTADTWEQIMCEDGQYDYISQSPGVGSEVYVSTPPVADENESYPYSYDGSDDIVQ